MKKLLAALVSVLLLFAACSPVEHVKSMEPLPDAVFEERNVFFSGIYVKGLYITDNGIAAADGKEDSPMRSFVLPLSYGRAYTADAGDGRLKGAAVCAFDPSELGPGEERALPDGGVLAQGQVRKVSYAPGAGGEWLVLFASANGEQPEIYVGESIVLAGEDPTDEWWTPVGITDAFGGKDDFADFKWDAAQMNDALFRELCRKYPAYVTEKNVGKDQSGEYDIQAYYFSPRKYDRTLLIVSGVHGTDTAATLALYKLLESICAEKSGDTGLSYLRTHVRIIVVPILNVWSTYNGQRMRNSENADLGIDFETVSQEETRCLCRLFLELKDENCVFLNLGCYNKWETTSELYYTCSAPERTAFFRTVNRIYNRLSERGLAKRPADTSCLMRGAWDARTPEGCAEYIYGIPAFGAYHSLDNYGRAYSAESLSTAAECFGNLAIAIMKD